MYCLTKRHLGCFYVLASRQVFVREEPVQVEHFVFRNCNVWVPRFHNEISHTNHTGLCVQKLVDISCVVKAGREVVHFKPLCVDCCREMLRKYDAERQHQKAFHALINTNERVFIRQKSLYVPGAKQRQRQFVRQGLSRQRVRVSMVQFLPISISLHRLRRTCT